MVEFVDDDTGTTHTESAEQLPPSLCVVDGVAVVRIVKSTQGDVIEISSYAADGRLLQRTIGTSSS